MKIIVQGLGRMGLQIARKLSENGHEVIAHNRSHEPIEEAVGYGATAAYTKDEAIKAYGDTPAVIWIMLPEEIVKSQVEEWLALIPAGSIIIDGGNSDFRHTVELNKILQDKGSTLIDVGTSGGVWGYQNGFSMMVGCDSSEAFQKLEPALLTLSKPEGAYHHFGPSGSGHFVKMVHNAIEYGMMESLAEGYNMLKSGPYTEIDLAAAGEILATPQRNYFLAESTISGCSLENPTLEGIDGYVAESGEARWTLEVSKDKGLPMPAIQAAFDVRLASQRGEVSFATKLLAAMRNKFGGHELNKDAQDK